MMDWVCPCPQCNGNGPDDDGGEELWEAWMFVVGLVHLVGGVER
jgi:hypothetical protein